MEDNIVFVKTPKGVEEMERRTFGLPQRSRHILIMVDGKKNRGTLAGLVSSPALDDVLAQLLNDGFLELVAVQEEVIEIQPPPPPAAVAAASVAIPDDPQERLKLARTLIINSTQNHLGMFGSGLIEKAKKAQSFDDIKSLLYDWHDAIVSEAGKKRGEELKAHLILLLT